jgi:hypothetical protein
VDESANQGRNAPRAIAITADVDPIGPVKAAVDLSFNRFGLDLEAPPGADLGALRALRISYLPVFSSFLPREERRTPAVIADELARGRVHGVIRNLLLGLKSTHREGALEKMLGRLFPALTGLSIAFDGVLPGLKRWLQAVGHGQFSDRALAQGLASADLPEEVHRLARRIASFAGVAP